MIHFYGEYEEGDGSLYYHYFLRKWGTYWDDVAADDTELVPRGYEIWYKPLIEAVTPTHMGYTVKAGKTMSDACMAIDGVTDVSELGDVHGYISVSNNDTGEVILNIPYSF